MKSPLRKLSVLGALAIGAALVVFAPVSAVLAAPAQHDHAQQAQADQGSGMKMGEMMAQGKANTARLDALMSQVKSASGDAKITAMADVIAVLLEERAAMQEHHATACAMMKK